jgi:glyoxylase I family protein
MFYRSYRPAPPLGDFVDYLWLHADSPSYRKERILPSGTIELVINLRDDELRSTIPTSPDVASSFRDRSPPGPTGDSSRLTQQSGAAFASVSNGNLTLKLSGPRSSGSRPLPDGRRQEPGGWNRIILEVDDLPSRVAAMRQAGFRFRNEIETGPGGQQIQWEDPDGNPVELLEPAS